jgi:hypothetical protein
MAMMAIFFIALAALAVIHFIYEAILAPSLRFELRLKLFALRDEIRILKLQHPDSLSDEVFRDLQSSLNATISRLKLIDLRILKTAYDSFEHDEKLRKRAEQRDELINACPIPEVRAIRQRQIWLVGYALLINSGGWVPYLVPVLISLFCAGRVMVQIRAVFALPENEINKIVPDLMVPA